MAKTPKQSNSNIIPGFNIPEHQPTGDIVLDMNLKKAWLDARREYMIQLAREQAKGHVESSKAYDDFLNSDSSYKYYIMQQRTYISWIAGYISAVNINTDDTYDILGKLAMNSVKLWIKNYCNNNPQKILGNAAEHLVNYLYQNRLTEAPEDDMKKGNSIDNTKSSLRYKDSDPINSRPSKKMK